MNAEYADANGHPVPPPEVGAIKVKSNLEDGFGGISTNTGKKDFQYREKLLDLDTLAKNRPVLREYSQFLQDIGYVNFDLIECNNQTYEFEGNASDPRVSLFLIDISKAQGYNQFTFDTQLTSALFDEASTENARFFIADPRTQRVIEVTRVFIFQFNPQLNVANPGTRAPEFAKLVQEVTRVRRDSGCPLDAELVAYMPIVEHLLQET